MIIIQKFTPVLLLMVFISINLNSYAQEVFPDGTPIPDWFRQNKATGINTLGKHYLITDYGLLNDSTLIHPNHRH